MEFCCFGLTFLVTTNGTIGCDNTSKGLERGLEKLAKTTRALKLEKLCCSSIEALAFVASAALLLSRLSVVLLTKRKKEHL